MNSTKQVSNGLSAVVSVRLSHLTHSVKIFAFPCIASSSKEQAKKCTLQYMYIGIYILYIVYLVIIIFIFIIL